jgi:hypothetical protein
VCSSDLFGPQAENDLSPLDGAWGVREVPVSQRSRAGLVRLQAYVIQKGESPFQANVLRPVVERNCVVARPGGEQRETNDQSVG